MKTKTISVAVLLLISATWARAYNLEGPKWLPGIVPFYLELGKFNNVAASALAEWDQYTGNVFLTTTNVSTTNSSLYSYDGRNSMVWSSAAHVTMPSMIMAWASYKTTLGFLIEADIVVNDHYTWSSYTDGGFGYDIGRVLLHEIGHEIGLAHSDSGNIMYAYYSNTWQLSDDDIAGARFLYGRRNVPDGGSTLGFLGAALFGLLWLRRLS